MWILLAMIAVMLFEQNPYLYISRSFFGIPDFTVIKLLGILGLGWSVAQIAMEQADLELMRSGLVKAFGVFLAATALSGLASGAGMEPVVRLMAVLLLMMLVPSVVRRQAQLVAALRTCALVMILVFPYSYRQMVRFGERLGVGLYESNYMALILVLIFPTAVALAYLERSAWKKAFWMGGAAVVLLQIVLTGSRGGFLALMIVFPFLAVRLLRRHLKILFGLALVLTVVIFGVSNPLRDRLSGTLHANEEQTGLKMSNESRLSLLHAGTRMMLANALFGVGLGQFKANIERYGDVPKAHIAHNTYLEIGAEQGVPTLIAFLLVPLAAFRSLRRSERLAAAVDNARLRALSIAIQAGLAGFLVGACFLSAQYENFFWLMLFLSVPMERIVRRQYRASRAEARVAQPSAAPGAPALGLAAR